MLTSTRQRPKTPYVGCWKHRSRADLNCPNCIKTILEQQKITEESNRVYPEIIHRSPTDSWDQFQDENDFRMAYNTLIVVSPEIRISYKIIHGKRD